MIWAWGVAAALAVATLLFGFNQSDPDVPKWTALHWIAIGCLVYLATKARHDVPQAVLWASGLFLWAVLSLLWSSDPKAGAVELTNGLALLVIFVFVATAERKHLLIAFPVMGALSLVAFVNAQVWPEYFGGFGNENFQTEFFIILIPFLIAGIGKAWQSARSFV